jgi:hypothetical protein
MDCQQHVGFKDGKNMEENKEDGLLATWRTQYKKYVDRFRVLVNYDCQQHVGFNNMDYQ